VRSDQELTEVLQDMQSKQFTTQRSEKEGVVVVSLIVVEAV